MNYESIKTSLKSYEGRNLTNKDLSKIGLTKDTINILVQTGDLLNLSRNLYKVVDNSKRSQQAFIDNRVISSYIREGRLDELFSLLVNSDFQSISRYAHVVLGLLRIRDIVCTKYLPKTNIIYKHSKDDLYGRFYEAIGHKDIDELKRLCGEFRKSGRKFDNIEMYEIIINSIIYVKDTKDAVMPYINSAYDIIRGKNYLSNEELDLLSENIISKDKIDNAYGNLYILDIIDMLKLTNDFSISAEYFDVCIDSYSDLTEKLVDCLDNGYYLDALDLLESNPIDIRPSFIYKGELNIIKILLKILKNNLERLRINSKTILKDLVEKERYDDAFQYYIESDFNREYAKELAILKGVK